MSHYTASTHQRTDSSYTAENTISSTGRLATKQPETTTIHLAYKATRRTKSPWSYLHIDRLKSPTDTPGLHAYGMVWSQIHHYTPIPHGTGPARTKLLETQHRSTDRNRIQRADHKHHTTTRTQRIGLPWHLTMVGQPEKSHTYRNNQVL